MKLVIVESPFAGRHGSQHKCDECAADVEKHIAYARAALSDCLRRGEAPFASHLLYTQDKVLDDGLPAERTLGIEAGLAWGVKAELTVVYTDFGISTGMKWGIEAAQKVGRPVEYRSLTGRR